MRKTKDPFCDFLKRSVLIGVIDWDGYHMEMGKHSGYSMCCIKNFIEVSKINDRVAEYMDKKYGYDSPSVGYVRCPNCRKKHINSGGSSILSKIFLII